MINKWWIRGGTTESKIIVNCVGEELLTQRYDEWLFTTQLLRGIIIFVSMSRKRTLKVAHCVMPKWNDLLLNTAREFKHHENIVAFNRSSTASSTSSSSFCSYRNRWIVNYLRRDLQFYKTHVHNSCLFFYLLNSTLSSYSSNSRQKSD